MSRKHRFESKALQYTYDRYVGNDPRRQAKFEEALEAAEIARQIYDLRTQSGLTQAQLAALVGTSISAISRLEDADYNGHSFGMLRRIATALDRRVEMRFVRLRRRNPSSDTRPTARKERASSKKVSSRASKKKAVA